MDHKQQHHEHHRHEREEHKKQKKQHEKAPKFSLPVHPLWLFVLGVLLMFGVLLVWIFPMW